MTCSISSQREIKDGESLIRIIRAEIREEMERQKKIEDEIARRYRNRWLDDEI